MTCAGAARRHCATGWAAKNARWPSYAAARCWPSRWRRSTARADEIHRARSAVRRDITRLVAARDRTRRSPVRPAGHAGSGGHPGPRLRRGADGSDAEHPAAVLRSVDDAPAGTRLRVRVADGADRGGE